LPPWSSRFTREAANPSDAHRRLRAAHDLAALLRHVEARVGANDYTIRYNNKQYQITHAQLRPGLRGATVRVEERGDETVWVRFRDGYLNVQICDPPLGPKPLPAPPREKKVSKPSTPSKPRNWMEGFKLQNSLPVWKVINQENGGWAPSQG
jgi:hypothetical protein